EEGLTMGECWDKYGHAYGGGVIADEDAVELEGLIYGVGKLGHEVALPPPRLVLSYPNAHSEAKPNRLLFLLTGPLGPYRVEVDGEHITERLSHFSADSAV